jgi:putative drug exporter of the RND superfamily
VSTLTRWVLAHKRIVLVGWIVLTVAGIAAAGPATGRLDQKFSVPGKEGWETNVAIAKHYRGTGGDTAALLPVVTLPKGKTVSSPGVKQALTKIDRRLAHALPGSRIASYASTGDRAFVSGDGRTTFALVYPRPQADSTFGENPKAESAARKAVRGATVAGEPLHLTGFDAL